MALMGITRLIAVSAFTLGTSLTQCQETRPPQEIFIPMDYESWPSPSFNAKPGDTVNVIMGPDTADPETWCGNRGGSLWLNPYTDILICENIDF